MQPSSLSGASSPVKRTPLCGVKTKNKRVNVMPNDSCSCWTLCSFLLNPIRRNSAPDMPLQGMSLRLFLLTDEGNCTSSTDSSFVCPASRKREPGQPKLESSEAFLRKRLAYSTASCKHEPVE